MPGGRPPLGPSIVEHLDGSTEAKRRLRTILEVLGEKKTIAQACAELGVERARYYVLQTEALVHAMEGLEPRPPGRPPRPEPSAETARIEELEREIEDLKFERTAAELREEVARVIPRVTGKGREAGEKKRPKRPW